jgi:hypothetical protein
MATILAAKDGPVAALTWTERGLGIFPARLRLAERALRQPGLPGRRDQLMPNQDTVAFTRRRSPSGQAHFPEELPCGSASRGLVVSREWGGVLRADGSCWGQGAG